MSEHSQLNERLWECNLQENGVNLGHMTTKSANNNISDLFMIARWIHYSKMLLKLIFTACVVQVKKKGDSVPYQPYGILRVKFVKFEPERWFHHIVALIQKAPLFPALQKHKRHKEFVWLKNLGMIDNESAKYRMMLNLHIDGDTEFIHDLAHSYLVRLDH
ncbi:putative abieta-7,13-dien-18-ol hydroxylase [Helianthus anomalus]